MDLTAVLVIGSPANRSLCDLLFEAGWTPVLRETILAAMAALHRQPFAAAVVDREAAEVDALELILNMRDLKPELPVVVLSRRRADADALSAAGRVTVAARGELLRELDRVVAEPAGTDAPGTRASLPVRQAAGVLPAGGIQTRGRAGDAGVGARATGKDGM